MPRRTDEIERVEREQSAAAHAGQQQEALARMLAAQIDATLAREGWHLIELASHILILAHE
ncbi:MAG TPA: hypothetical protein VJQ45_03450, partial [Ktedonobacterales bacterium]|nr:hypothetical protein [Ktedonobacterales bacterium]